MNAELICVGSEILSGKIINTNAQFISNRLLQLGPTCTRQFFVDDNKARVADLVKNSVANCDLLIVSGGLGPTEDDITKEAVCEALGLELSENKKLKDHLEAFFTRLGKTPTQNNYKQATAPDNSVIFKNDKGTACGLGIELSGKVVILLPGPPKELTHMFNNYVVPYLHKFDSKVVVTHTLSVFGMGESAIETAIKPLMVSGGPIIATYCKENECEISVTATAATKDEAESVCSNTIFKIKAILGDVVYGTDSSGMAEEVVNMLRKSGLKVATAESCTGGMLSSSLTSVSGASDAVEIGILAYSNRIKNEALSVPQDVLLEEGAISAETAMYLAKNVRILSGADIGVGVTGNAGPTAQENKPVGLVYIAISDKNNYCIKKLELPSNYSRDRIRGYATLAALDLVRKYILARPASLPDMRSLDEDFFFDEQTSVLTSTVSENKFTVFEVDENYNFDDAEPEKPEKPESDPDVILDINSFLTFNDTTSSDILKTCKQFIVKHWVKLVSALVLVALLISSTVLVSNFTNESHQIKLINQARDEFRFDDAGKHEATGVFSSFDSLVSDNSDIKAWLKIEGTEIDNPVYQAENNKYYQNHNMANKKSRFGALFFDCGNNIEHDSISQNLTIYGHNTTNGIMFGELDEYRSLSYYKNHPIIKLKTLYNQNDYLIFAVFVTNADPDDDNGNIFNYAKPNFKSSDDFAAFIGEAKKRSVINVPTDLYYQDEIITLSTYSDEFENARFVVMAKKIITANEINISKNATLNPNAKYPQAWYDENGLKGYKELQSEDASSVSDESSSQASSALESSSDIDSSSTDASGSELSSLAGSSSELASSTIQPTACTHSYSGKYENKDANGHTYVCSLCGTTVVEQHIFTFERAEPGYYCSPATCLSPAIYFKSCVCGIKGNETFTYGDRLAHVPLLSVFNKDDHYHWNPCQTVGCNERLNITEHTYGENGLCTCSHSNQTTE